MGEYWVKNLAETCPHEGEYLRMGDHPDVTGRFEAGEFQSNDLVCLHCETSIDHEGNWG